MDSQIDNEKQLLELIDEYNIPVVKIDEGRNYWLVRTQAGEFYDQFYFDDFIAIGWDEFNDLEEFESVEKSVLIKDMEKEYPENKKPGLIYSQIYRFLYEMNTGDVVMIPSTNSTHISFGVITTDAFIEEISETQIEEGVCPFQKRRRVHWIKTVPRSDLDPYLYRMMQTHLTISNAGEYEEAIDRTLHSFYVKSGRAHLVLNVTTNDEIAGIDLVNSISNILDLVPYIKNPYNPEYTYDKSVIDLKLRVQSAGIMEFVSAVAPWAVLGIGILLNYVVGGKIKATFTKGQKDIEASSDGLLEKLLKFRKHDDEQKLKELELKNQDTIEKLKIEIPKETKNLPVGGDQED
ncbi:restriction endonuclease [Siminovitchia fortis]|uniref:restriction endonuclease n=2 Tax=Bacillales TaxID=1385 RepID=UPI0011A57488|nr:hypothetical protein [Siminovitchia fortis]